MKTFLGIDPGINTTVAVMHGRRIRFKIAYSKKVEVEKWPDWRREAARLYTLRTSLYMILTKIPGKKIIGLEGLAYGSKHRVALMGKIEYILQVALLTLPHMEKIYMIPPATWKKVVGGHGRSTKEHVAEVLNADYPQMPKTTNLNCTDALAILLTAKFRWEEEYERD